MKGDPIPFPQAADGALPFQRAVVVHAVILGGVIFLASLFGILTRPVGQLAAFWPANALMLGLMARNRQFATPLAWVAAGLGFVAADLLTGGGLRMTLLLTAANMVGVLAGGRMLLRLDPADRGLSRPTAVLQLCLVATAGAFGAAMIGAVVSPIIIGGTVLQGWVFWFVTELVNYVALLPVILTAPDLRRAWRGRRARPDWEPVAMAALAPAGLLLLSCVAGIVVDGPGAVAFPVPALLWCALTYRLFTTTALTLLFSIWALLAISSGWLEMPIDDERHTLLSLRLGVTLMALAPITVASATAVRNELLHRLQHVAAHDQLTGLLNRSAFTARVATAMRQLAGRKRPAAMLMIDIDHFKTINDRFGHAGGDQVLAAFAARVGACLRDTDAFGRLGGEEFGILLPDCREDEAGGIAERIRAAFADGPILLKDGRTLRATASIGVVFAALAPTDAETMLLAADDALYRAKAAGRNRVEEGVFAARPRAVAG
ncbi:MAG TPA: diguanylate cyclase [Roseomonas sp.]